MAEQARRYAADVAWLLERRDRFVEVACPACDATESRAALAQVRPRLPPLRALRDRLHEPAPRPGAARRVLPDARRTTSTGTRVVFPASEDGAARADLPAARRARRRARAHGTRRRARWSTSAPASARSARRSRRLGALRARDRARAGAAPGRRPAARKGLEVIEAPVEQAELASGVDVVTSFEVIEHLFSPRAFVERCADAPAPGRPAAPHLPERAGASTSRCSGELSATVDAEHLNYLHPASLGALLERCGFEVARGADARPARRRAGAQDGARRRVRLARQPVPAAAC